MNAGFKGSACVLLVYWFEPILWQLDATGWIETRETVDPRETLREVLQCGWEVAATRGGPGDDFGATVRVSSCILLEAQLVRLSFLQGYACPDPGSSRAPLPEREH